MNLEQFHSMTSFFIESFTAWHSRSFTIWGVSWCETKAWTVKLHVKLPSFTLWKFHMEFHMLKPLKFFSVSQVCEKWVYPGYKKKHVRDTKKNTLARALSRAKHLTACEPASQGWPAVTSGGCCGSHGQRLAASLYGHRRARLNSLWSWRRSNLVTSQSSSSSVPGQHSPCVVIATKMMRSGQECRK